MRKDALSQKSTFGPKESLDTLKTISKSAVHFFSGTMLSRITGMLRDVAMAYVFGTTSAIAALLVAFRFAHLFRRIFGEGAMQTALIPHFEELKNQSSLGAATFFRDLTFGLIVFLTFLIGLIIAGLWGLLALDFLSAANAEIAWLTLVMMPSLLFICLFGINASLMQCQKNYFLPSAAPIVFNLIWIGGVFFAARLPDNSSMTVLSLFIVLACVAQWAVTVPSTYATLASHGLFGVFKKINIFSSEICRLAVPLTLGIVGVAASQINNALDSVFARLADDEGPALLWYAIRLQQLPLALFGIALSGALLPPLSRAIKSENTDQFQQFLKFACNRTLSFMIPITAALFVFGDTCVSFIYAHGDFSVYSVIGTVKSLWGYTVGLVPMALVLVLAPAFYAKNDYRTPSFAAALSVLLNIALNALLVIWFDLGAPSVALATSVSAWFNMGWLIIALNKSFSNSMRKSFFELIPSILKISLVSVVASCVVVSVKIFLLNQISPIEILNGGIPSVPSSLLIRIWHLGLTGCVFLGTTISLAILFQVKELTLLIPRFNKN